MTHVALLEEHLKGVHLTENVIMYFSKIKANTAKIGDALGSANIIKIYNVFDFVKVMTPSEVNSFAKKTFKSRYIKSEMNIKNKLKKGPKGIIDLFTVFHTAVSTVKEISKEPEIQTKATEALEHLDMAMNEFKRRLKPDGLSIIGLAHVIQHILGGSTFAVPLLKAIGLLFMSGCCIVLSLAFLVRMFMEAKKGNIKVIS